jgi:hypothetical protein
MVRTRRPVRTCMGCGVRVLQSELCRIVYDKQSGDLLPDPQRWVRGRGGYLHVRRECLATFACRKGMLRSLRASVGRSERGALVKRVEALWVE